MLTVSDILAYLFSGQGLRVPVLIKLVENPIEDGIVEVLVRQLASIGNPADDMSLQNGHIALYSVLMKDRQGCLRKLSGPLRGSILYSSPKMELA